MESIRTRIVAQKNISRKERESMLSLQRIYFENVSRENFFADLSQKDACILVQNHNDVVLGFSTIQWRRERYGSSELMLLFSGDTIVRKDLWSKNLIASGFGAWLEHLILRFPNNPCYWLLLSKGFRTYRFLPVYFHRFYPCFNSETPAEVKRLMDEIAFRRFGNSYDAQSGVLRLDGKKDYLKTEFAEIPLRKRNDPHINFFLAKNSSYHKGDELVCLAELSVDNLNKRAYRVIKRANVSWELP